MHQASRISRRMRQGPLLNVNRGHRLPGILAFSKLKISQSGHSCNFLLSHPRSLCLHSLSSTCITPHWLLFSVSSFSRAEASSPASSPAYFALVLSAFHRNRSSPCSPRCKQHHNVKYRDSRCLLTAPSLGKTLDLRVYDP